MIQVLVIGYVWPEPNSSAAGSHMMSLLRAFRAQGWSVEFASPAQMTEHMVDLSLDGISSQAIELNNESFDRYIKQLQPDIVLFDRFMMEEQFGWRVEKQCPEALRILDTEDLQCLRYARHQAVKQNRLFSDDDLVNDIAKREIAAIFRSDMSLIISTYEMTLLQTYFHVPVDILHHLPFMVDLSACPSQTHSFEARQHFMTIGNFRHAPNWDAVLQLQQMWPQIRQQLPQAELHIYGSYPPPKATALHNPKTGFLIKGWVADAQLAMEQARICLAPLRFGAGIKGKLLDAMIMQTPSITTPIGSEGMHEDASWPGVIASDNDTFIQAAVSLYQDKQAWAACQQYASSLLKSKYDVARLSRDFIEKIILIRSQLEQHRRKNFIGGMMRHHSMYSTKYMSQWIEAKNK